ncbi:MAG: phytoene/squalene synthase family protein [Myxococcales bacterium]|nr:phytoene/squalene synthase family protein [Myxococcales bacterium]
MPPDSTHGAAPSAASPEDRAFCDEILPRVSRTFALSISMLPESLRDAVRAAYLLCRIVDTIEDDTSVPLEVRRPIFAEFDALMRDDARDPTAFEASAEVFRGEWAEAALCSRAGATFRSFRGLSEAQREAIRPSVLEMSHGMQQYVERMVEAPLASIADLTDLERYCYFVAGTVGELLTPLFLLDNPGISAELESSLRERAVSFGLGLQLVNIVKDVADDLERGICFVPRELLSSFGLSVHELLDERQREAGLAVVRAICRVARTHLERAREYTCLWPTSASAVRLFCAVPLALALGTLGVVEQGDDTLRAGRNPKVSREFVTRLIADAQFVVRDDGQLLAYFESAARGE